MLVRLLLTLSLTATPDPETFEGVRERALEAYKALDYKRACALYERAAKQQPEHAAVRADLGLCLARLGKKAEAAKEGARAVFLARPNREGVQPDDERTRQSAYFNLFKLGERLKLPGINECAPLKKAPGCDRAVHACEKEFEAGGIYLGQAVQLALSPAAAVPPTTPNFDFVSRSDVVDLMPPGEGFGTAVKEAVRAAPVLVREEQRRYQDRCGALVSWKCAESEGARIAIEACYAARGASDGGNKGDSNPWQECFDHVCATAEEHPSPQIAAELADAESMIKGCDERPLMATRCAFVLADACSGVVGVVCETGERGTTTGWKPRVGELKLKDEPAP